MNDEIETPVFPMSIEQKIAELQTRKADLEMRHGALRRDYGSARLDQDMRMPGATARLAAINSEMIDVAGQIADVTAMLTAAQPRAAAAQAQASAHRIADDWQEVRANCDAAQREIDELVPQLRDCLRRLTRINQFRAQAYMAVHQRLAGDMQALLHPLPVCADLTEQCQIAAGESEYGLQKLCAAWTGSLLARAPADFDDRAAA